MLGLRIILTCVCALAPLLIAVPAYPQGSRLEDRTDSKIEAKENEGKPGKAGKAAPAGKQTVWNLDGGVFFATDGHLPSGSCFRLAGQMNAPDFFDGLRRVDNDAGSSYLLRNKPVTEYPEQVQLVLHLLDFPCTADLKDTAVRPPLTREQMSKLHLALYWKDGLRLRPVEDSQRTGASVRKIGSYVTGAAAEELAPRYEWNFAFTVNSAKVPLTNDLVLVIENEEHKIAARVAARM
jgi:hypothetical protein